MHTIRLATPAERPDAALLILDELGHLLPDHAGVVVAVGPSGVAGAMSFDTLERAAPIDRWEQVRRIVPSSPVFVKAGAVRPEWRGRGLATAMVAKIVDLHPGRGFAADAWVRNGQVPAAPALEANGFSAALDIPAFWRIEMLADPEGCMDCGVLCACLATVYRRAPK